MHAPNLNALRRVDVTLNGFGTLPLANWQHWNDGFATLSGAAYAFPGLMNAEQVQFGVNGGSVDLPVLTSLADGGLSLSGGATANVPQLSNIDGADLVVASSVNPGAQVIADGSVHIWGPLRGRALAGAQGRADARIFCLSLEAELVSVNGEYVMAEEIPDNLRGRPAQVSFDGQRVKISPL